MNTKPAKTISRAAPPDSAQDIPEKALSPLDYAFSDLELNCSDLYTLFSELNTKLQPMQSAVCAGSTDGDKRLSRGSSPVVHRIESVSCRLSDLADGLRILINSLEV